MNTNLYTMLRVYFESLMWTEALAFTTEMAMLLPLVPTASPRARPHCVCSRASPARSRSASWALSQQWLQTFKLLSKLII